MTTRYAQTFVDPDGQPFDERIQLALRHVRAPLLSRFPALGDDTVITEVLEEAGRRVLAHERITGPARSLAALMWVTAQNVARSRLRRPTMRMTSAALDDDARQGAFAALEAVVGSVEEMETRIFLRELLEHLTHSERRLTRLKAEGLSSREIAQRLGISIGQVNIAFFRLKGTLAHLLQRAERQQQPRRPVKARPKAQREVATRVAGREADRCPIAEAADRHTSRRPRQRRANGSRS